MRTTSARPPARPTGSFRADVGATVVGQVGSLLLSVLSAVVVARVLGPHQRGVLAVVMLVPGVVLACCALGAPLACLFLAGRGDVGVRDLSAGASQLALAGTGLGAVVVVVAATVGGRWTAGATAGEVVAACAVLPSGLLAGSLTSLLRGLGRAHAAASIDLTQAFVASGGSAVAVGVLRLGVVGVVLSTLAATVAGCALAFRHLRADGATLLPRPDRSVRRAMLGYGMRADVGNVMHLAGFRFDTLVLNAYVGAAGLGVYAVATRLAEMLFVLPYSVAVLLLPQAARSPAATALRTPRLFALTLVVTAAAGAGMALLAVPMLPRVFGPAYTASLGPLLVLLPGTVAFGSANVLMNDVAGRGRPGLVSANAAVGLVLSVGLDLLVVPRFGIVGAAWVSTAVFAVNTGLALLFHLRVTGTRLPDFGRRAVHRLPAVAAP